MVGIIAGILLAQPDTGTLIVIAVTAIGMFLVGGGSWKHALGLILIISIGVMILASFEQYFYIKDRFLTYFDPEGTGWVGISNTTISYCNWFRRNVW